MCLKLVDPECIFSNLEDFVFELTLFESETIDLYL